MDRCICGWTPFIPLLITILLFTACGREPRRELSGLDNYIKLFEYEGALRNYNFDVEDLVVEFGTLNKETLGICYTGAETPRIVLDHNSWDKMDKDTREVLVFHELGHCILDLNHDNSKPAVMNSFLMMGSLYNYNRKLLLDELFKHE